MLGVSQMRNVAKQVRSIAMVAGCVGLLACTQQPAAEQASAVSQVAPVTDSQRDVPAATATTPAPVAAEPVVRVVGTTLPHLRGKSMPPYPDGLREVQGFCIPGGPEYERVCDFGFGVLGRDLSEDKAATQEILIATRAQNRGAAAPNWLVMDARTLPMLPAGYQLNLGNCRLDGKDTPEIAAAVRMDDQSEYLKDVAWALRFDTAGGALMDIEPARVDCANGALGI